MISTAWKTSDGRSIPYTEMEMEHLINALNQVERGHGSCSASSYIALKEEARRRCINYRQFANTSLKGGELTMEYWIKKRLQRQLARQSAESPVYGSNLDFAHIERRILDWLRSDEEGAASASGSVAPRLSLSDPPKRIPGASVPLSHIGAGIKFHFPEDEIPYVRIEMPREMQIPDPSRRAVLHISSGSTYLVESFRTVFPFPS